MTLRPIAARWFELLTVPEELALTMECLSHTGLVELEASSQVTDRLLFPGFAHELRAHRELAQRYGRYWPIPLQAGPQRKRLAEMLESARRSVAAWIGEADPIIAAIERASQEATELLRVRTVLQVAPHDFPDIHLLAASGPKLKAGLLELPPKTALRNIPALVLTQTWQTPTASYLLVVGRATEIDDVERRVATLKGRSLSLPLWLPSSINDAIVAMDAHLSQLAERRAQLMEHLSGLSERHHVAQALGDIALVQWLIGHAKELRGSERLAWLTGWTIDGKDAVLRRALDKAGLHYVLRISAPPTGMIAPEILQNPRWARPFEALTRMLGMPGRDESDPSQIVAIVASLIFGFMFGDVGQGVIILFAGLILSRRIALTSMLIPGGMISVLFGVLFGSVFCRDDVIPALWIRPLSQPIEILIVGVIVGAVIILIGLVLDAIEMHWRGEALQWWGQRAGLLTAYIGVSVSPVWRPGLWSIAVGACWYVVGASLLARRQKVSAAASAAASFVQQGLQILVNTLSFARIGAFALAHAGLSLAIVEIATASGTFGYWVVLAIGNVLIIVLEGVVVSIQTTRLLLFEFFIRFLTGAGREFKPLQPPAAASDLT